MLIIAGLLEVVWATSMKYSNGFTVLWPSVLTVVTMIISFGLLSVAMKSLPLGTSYMIWVGIGAIGAFIAATWRAERTAALLFLPYLAWVAYAALLNAALWWLN